MIQEETEEQRSDMHFRFQQRDYKNELLKAAYREAILCYCKDFAHREHKSIETRLSSLCEPEVLSGLENQRHGKGRIRGVFKLTLVHPSFTSPFFPSDVLKFPRFG